MSKVESRLKEQKRQVLRQEIEAGRKRLAELHTKLLNADSTVNIRALKRDAKSLISKIKTQERALDNLLQEEFDF